MRPGKLPTETPKEGYKELPPHLLPEQRHTEMVLAGSRGLLRNHVWVQQHIAMHPDGIRELLKRTTALRLIAMGKDGCKEPKDNVGLE